MTDAEKRVPLLQGPSRNSKNLPDHALHRRHDSLVRRFSLFGIALVCSVFLLILFVSHRLVTSTTLEQSPFQSIGRTIQSWSMVNDANNEKLDNSLFSLYDDNVTGDIYHVVAEERRLLAQEMTNYKYPNGRYNISASGLSDLVPELGGQPIRNIIITTWRSGSTFLGDILNSHPANFYHYEPLLDFGIIQIRGPPHSGNATAVLKNLLNCNYTGLDQYLRYGKSHIWLFNHNARLWEQCMQHPHICWLPEFLSPFCSLFPFQSMKVVRLRLALVEELLDDPRLNIRVLLLVRDPRGTLQSRKHRDWCPGNPDCDEPALLCADLVADYSSAVRLAARYPSRFLAMRYEDVSLEPFTAVRRIFRFYGLDFHPSVSLFLDTHTKVDAGGVSSTYRNSKSAPFHWRQDLTHKEVRQIQGHCGPAMKHWGYLKADNASHQHEFNPLTEFHLA